eukprot:gene10705-12406_t
MQSSAMKASSSLRAVGSARPSRKSLVVRAEAKEIEFDTESRRRLQIGINKVADAVASTLGPRDGTTTASVLAREMVHFGLQNVATISSGNDIEIGEMLAEALEKNVATISSGNDIEIGEMLAEALEKVGSNGVLSIETSTSTETVVVVQEGMAIDRGYISPQFVNVQERMACEFENCKILITDQKIESLRDIIPILEQMGQTKAPLLIIAEDVTENRSERRGGGSESESQGGGGKRARARARARTGARRRRAETRTRERKGARDEEREREREPGRERDEERGPEARDAERERNRSEETRAGSERHSRSDRRRARTESENRSDGRSTGLRGILNVAAIKAPGFGERRKALLMDIAITTGAEFIGKDLAMTVENTVLEQLGSARKVVITANSTTVIAEDGNKEEIDMRVAQLKKELADASSVYDSEKLSERIAKLSGGVAVIQVGAATEAELEDRKLRIEDAKNATFAAIEEGIAPGGGAALLHLSELVPEFKNTLTCPEEKMGADLVMKAMRAPCRVIAENCGIMLTTQAVMVEMVQTPGPKAPYKLASAVMVEMVQTPASKAPY